MQTSSYESLSHSKWGCKYHVVFIPKGRKKVLYGKIREFLGQIFHELGAQRGSKILEGHLVVDHVHMLIRIPPKYSVSEVIGYIKGKSAIAVARNLEAEQETSMAKVFGLVDMRCQLLDIMRNRSKHMLSVKKSTIASSLME